MDFVVLFCQDILPSLEDSVISELKCSTCKDLMHEQIFHCERGHSYCSSCHTIGATCRQCGAPCTGNRTHHLERVFQSVTFPCKYLDQGCQKRCHPKLLKQHQEECQTFRLRCPLVLKCPFVGTKRQVVFHCQLTHGPFTFPLPSKQIIIHERLLDHSKNVYLYHSNDNLFQAKVHLKSSKIQLEMNRISSPSEMEEIHGYQLNLYDFGGNVLETFRKKCSVVNGWDYREDDDDDNYHVEISVCVLNRCRYFTVEFVQNLDESKL